MLMENGRTGETFSGGDVMPISPAGEVFNDAGTERRAEFGTAETGGGMTADGILQSMPVTPTMPPLPQDGVAAVQPIGDVDENPVVARDTGKIEKEWVNRAKKIVAETRDDPYERGEKVKDLKADYMMKRFNRKIGDRN
jgi:hypothetical protein